MDGSKEWISMEPAFDKFKEKKKNDLTALRRPVSIHDTRPRKKEKAPTRSKSLPMPGARKSLSGWKTRGFGDEEASGPGMRSGPVVPIGSAKEQGPWDKSSKDRSASFIGITRKPRKPKLPCHNEDLPDG
jgi:hypothetical protein